MKAVKTIFSISLKARFGNLNLDLGYKGSKRVLGVFGVSGAGKTTFLECLAGLRKVMSGQITVAGEIWLDTETSCFVPTEKRHMGYVPQDHLLFPHKNVRGNLEAGKARAVQGGQDFQSVLKKVVAVLELEPLLDRSIDQLSGGERQRVSLGRALCSGPKLLLLDEPLASLDLPLRRKILPFLIRIKEAFELPMVVVSHNPTELQVLCDEVLILENGRNVMTGSPNELFTSDSLFNMAKEHGFENVFSGTIIEKSDQVDRLSLSGKDGDMSIQIPATDAFVGDRVLASIGSDNVLIGLEQPRGLSARNCLSATISRVENAGTRWLVHAVVVDAVPEFVVEVTCDAIEALQLESGARIYLVFKASSVSTLTG